MRHLKNFRSLFESTSAGSQEVNNMVPFKYTKIYDPRIGYNKQDFITDVEMIMSGLEEWEREDMKNLIFSVIGTKDIKKILNMRIPDLNVLIKSIENFLDSKADFELNMYPDGYVLCFENIRMGKIKYDIYYSPSKKKIRTVAQTGDTLEPEKIYTLSGFPFDNFDLEEDDFKNTIEQVDLKFKPVDTSGKIQQ